MIQRFVNTWAHNNMKKVSFRKLSNSVGECCTFFWGAQCVFCVGGCCCARDDLLMNSKCYRKFERQLTWYSASNDCLSIGGSLAVFSVIGRPSDNSQLIAWLNTSGTGKTYWIGLLRSWWKITSEGKINA